MKKKGISLIVLVITIIVMVILAAIVIISMSETGVIDKVKYAVQSSNEKQVENLASTVWLDVYMDNYSGEELKVEVIDRLAEQGIAVNDYNIKVTESGVGVTKSNGKVETLANTSWKFNDNISDYDFFGVFDYENQTGWENLPNGCVIKNKDTEYGVWGFTLTALDDIIAFGTVQDISVENSLTYVPVNNVSTFYGWAVANIETVTGYLNGEITSIEELLARLKQTSAPIVIFSEATNEALENKELIDWMYKNAKRID